MKIENKGFLKIGSKVNLNSRQKIDLIRKGNELYNNKQYLDAKKIYMVTSYGDGLVRIGDFYFKNKLFKDALEMYIMAKHKTKIENCAKQLVYSIRKMLKKA